MSNNSVPGNREGSHSSPSDQNEAEMSRLTSRFGLNLVALSIFEKKLAQTFLHLGATWKLDDPVHLLMKQRLNHFYSFSKREHLTCH